MSPPPPPSSSPSAPPIVVCSTGNVGLCQGLCQSAASLDREDRAGLPGPVALAPHGNRRGQHWPLLVDARRVCRGTVVRIRFVVAPHQPWTLLSLPVAITGAPGWRGLCRSGPFFFFFFVLPLLSALPPRSIVNFSPFFLHYRIPPCTAAECGPPAQREPLQRIAGPRHFRGDTIRCRSAPGAPFLLLGPV